ncbi:hypothetical protein MIR68_009818 [Amoeboaphelidium protococcarum]|nr:hypothetical protein MIR68_009818 [Amoeboaphelidium protococcarum]
MTFQPTASWMDNIQKQLDDLKQLREDVVAQKQQIDQQKQQIDQQKQQIDKLLNDNEHLRQDNLKLRKEVESVKAENEQIKRENAQIKQENLQLKEQNQRLRDDMEKLAGDFKEIKGKIRDSRLSVAKSTADYNLASFTIKCLKILVSSAIVFYLVAIIIAANNGNVSLITLMVGWIPVASFLLPQYLKALGDMSHHDANMDNQRLLKISYEKLFDTNKID